MICVESWFDVNKSTFDEDMRKKTIFTFSFPFTLTSTFRPHISSPIYSCPAICVVIKLEVSVAFMCRKVGGTARCTDGQTDVVQHLMRSQGKAA